MNDDKMRDLRKDVIEKCEIPLRVILTQSVDKKDDLTKEVTQRTLDLLLDETVDVMDIAAALLQYSRFCDEHDIYAKYGIKLKARGRIKG